MANFLSFERLEYYHGKLLTKINGLLSGKADKSEVNDLNEGFSEVIKQMYGADITENGAPTIREIAQDESNVVQGNLNTHINDTTPHITNAERTKLAGVETGAQVNQPAFSNVKVGTTTIAADAQTDTLEFVAGNGITITPDATNDKITIANSGIRTVTTGSSNGTISVNGSNVAVKGLGSAAYTASTAYDTAGAAASALGEAKNYTNTKIGELMNNSSEAVDSIMELAAAMEENETVVKALESAIGTKANTTDLTSHTGNTSNPHNVTKSQIGLGNVENKSSATIRGELTKDNVTTALGYTPPTADTHYTSKNVVGSSASAFNNTTSALTNENVYLNSVENGQVTSAHKISGSGATTVTTDTSGNIIISSTAYGLSNGTGTAGLIKTSSTVNSSSGYTACPVINGVPYYKDTNTTYTLGSFNVTATATELNVLDGITASTAELNYCDGAKSNIQDQIDTANAAIIAVDNKIKEITTAQIDQLFT